MKTATLFNILVSAAILAIFAAPAHAIVTKNCPKNLRVQYAKPNIEADYAVDAYEEYFLDNEFIEDELKLVETKNATCKYEPLRRRASPVYKAVISGTFRKGSSFPAMLETHMVLPIDGTNGEDIGDAIVYSYLSKVSEAGISLKGTETKIFYQSANCTDGPCVSSHIYVGTYNKVHAR